MENKWYFTTAKFVIFVIMFLALISVPPINYIAIAINFMVLAITRLNPLFIFLFFAVEAWIISTLLYRWASKI